MNEIGPQEMDLGDGDRVQILRRLREVSRRGEVGFRQAAVAAGDGDLRYLFTSYSMQRATFGRELAELAREGRSPEAGQGEEGPGKVLGGADDSGDEVWGAGTGDILQDCALGEREAIRAYQQALGRTTSPAVRRVIAYQLGEIEGAQARIRALRSLTG